MRSGSAQSFRSAFDSVSAHSAITAIHEMANFVADPLSDYLACTPVEELIRSTGCEGTGTACRESDLIAGSTIFSSKVIVLSMLR